MMHARVALATGLVLLPFDRVLGADRYNYTCAATTTVYFSTRFSVGRLHW